MRKPTALLTAALAAGTIVAAALPAGASVTAITPAQHQPARLSLPRPTGRYPVGTIQLHLTDRSRANPWAASPARRELMASVWYPARDAARYPPAPHMLPAAAAHFGSAAGPAATLYRIPPGTAGWAATLTSGHQDAPAARNGGPFPVVLYSPGAGEPRTWGTTLVQDLASRGYVVVTIDATYEASEVEFPGGQVVTSVLQAELARAQKNHTIGALLQKVLDVRVADTRFVAGQVAALAAGHHPGHDPGAGHLPTGLAAAIDPHRIGMFGVSAGGFTAAQAMAEDPRIKAGIDLDGATDTPLVTGSQHLAPVFDHGLRQPFLLMGDPATTHRTVASWRSFWNRTPGWHLDLTLRGASGEHSYKDAEPLIGELARQGRLPAKVVRADLGTVNPARAVTAEEACIAAFFGRFLRGQASPLLDGPSPRYPEIQFVR
jgi:platelet-activating factor acetylhydrolase isoform II